MSAPKVDARAVLERIAQTNADFSSTADRDDIVRMTRSMLERQAEDLRLVSAVMDELIEAAQVAVTNPKGLNRLGVAVARARGVA